MRNRIKELRKLEKMNQTDFGSRIGLKQSSVASIETGVSGISDQTIKSICREFHVNEEWLRYGKGDPFVAQQEQTDVDILRELVENAGGNEIILAIMRCWAGMDQPQRDALNKFIDKLVEEYNKTKNADCTPPKATE